MTSLRSLFTLYPFLRFINQRMTLEAGHIVYKGSNQNFYIPKKSGTIHAKMGCIEPLKQRDKENKHHKGLYTEYWA